MQYKVLRYHVRVVDSSDWPVIPVSCFHAGRGSVVQSKAILLYLCIFSLSLWHFKWKTSWEEMGLNLNPDLKSPCEDDRHHEQWGQSESEYKWQNVSEGKMSADECCFNWIFDENFWQRQITRIYLKSHPWSMLSNSKCLFSFHVSTSRV